MSAFTVLLVEPDFSNVPQVRDALTAGQSDMRWVTSGDFAMRYLRREEGFDKSPRPDAILLTWNLRSDDAERFKGSLKNDPALSRIPVITLAPEQSTKTSMHDAHACRTRARQPLERPHRHHAVRH